MKATKTWHDMLGESLQEPTFRKEWKDANAELAELDKIIFQDAQKNGRALPPGFHQLAPDASQPRDLQRLTVRLASHQPG